MLPPTLKLVAVPDASPIGDFIRDWFVIKVRCACGHERELRGEFVRRVIGAHTGIGQLRRRLRCHKCGERRALIEIFQLPR